MDEIAAPRRRTVWDSRWVYPALAVALVLTVLLVGRCPGAHANAQDFTLPTVSPDGRADGDRLALHDQRGKVVVLDFWATWCGPCRMTTPALVRVAHRFHDRGVVVVGVNVDQDGPQAVPLFMRRYGIDYPVLWDDGHVSELYSIRSLPTLMVIDRQGRVRYSHIGVESEDDLADEIQRLL